MDEETTQVKTRYDDFLEEMPSEVQDFMWSDLYDIIITAIQQTLALTDEQTVLVKNAGYDLLMKYKTMEEIARELEHKGIKNDMVIKILYLLDTEIITRAENITEFFTENPDEDTATTPDKTAAITAPTPSDMIARLNQTLTRPTTFTPTKRTYTPDVVPTAPTNTTPSIDQTPSQIISPKPVEAPSLPHIEKTGIDPYRELPKE